MLQIDAKRLLEVRELHKRQGTLADRSCKTNPRARSQAQTISGAQRGPSYRATSYAFRGVQIERLSRRRFSGDGADRGLDDKDSSKFKCGEIRKASGGLLVQRPTRTQCCIFRSAALRGML